MAPSIDSMVFRLRRMYARERTQLAAYEFADAVTLNWDRFSRSDADVLGFMRALWPTDAYLPNRDSVLVYLERCKTHGVKPLSRQITIRLIPRLITEDDEYL